MEFKESFFIKDLDQAMQKSLDSYVKQMDTIRSGQPSTSLVDDLMIDCYGAAMPLKQLALVSVPDATTILIEPWDKTLLSEINRKLLMSNLGVNPVVDAQFVRINIPPLSEERREELVKLVRKVTEDARVSVRSVRKSFNNHVKKMIKDKEITEDMERHLELKVQDKTNIFVKKIEQLFIEKEKKLRVI